MEENTQLEELKRIAKILILAHAETLGKEIEKVATTDERKKIWVFIDSNRMSKDIAKEVGITVQAVNKFLRAASAAGLIGNPRGKPPYRIIDYVPPAWIELVKLPEEIEASKSVEEN
jgi:predicted transcriptional regulator